MRIWRWIGAAATGGLLCALAGPAAASECFPMSKKVDMCQHARRARDHMVQDLPKSSGNTTLIAVAAVGATLQLTVQIGVTEARYRAMMQAAHANETQVKRKVDGNTRKSVCSGDDGYMFVRLGGKVQQIYKSLDGVQLQVSTVTSCPQRPLDQEPR